MPHPSRNQLERSRFWLKTVGLTTAIGLHAGVFAFLMHSAQPKMAGEPAQEEIIGVSLFDLNELEENVVAEEVSEQVTEETIAEEPEIESEPEPEIEPEPEPEPEPIVEEAEIPEPVVEPPKVEPAPKPRPKPKPEPKPEPKPKPRAEPKPEAVVGEETKPATAPVVSNTEQPTGGQQARAVDPSQPRVVHQVNYLGAPPRPNYPRAAQRRNEQGKVIVRVLISTQGTVADVWVKTSSGHDRLDQAALAAVRGVRFKPYTENGVAFRAMADIPFDFVL